MVVFSASLSYIIIIVCICFKEVQLETLDNQDGDEINDAQFNDCLKQNLIKAVPLWLSAYDPYKLPEYTGSITTVTSIYDFIFSNNVLEGLADYYIKSINCSPINKNASISIFYPKLVFHSDLKWFTKQFKFLRSSFSGPSIITFTGALLETKAHATVNGTIAYVDQLLFGLSVDNIKVQYDASQKVANGILGEMKPQMLKKKTALEQLAINKINELMMSVPASFVFRVIESFGQC